MSTQQRENSRETKCRCSFSVTSTKLVSILFSLVSTLLFLECADAFLSPLITSRGRIGSFPNTRFPSKPISIRKCSVLSVSSGGNDEEDDGWGTSDSSNTDTMVDLTPTKSPKERFETDRKLNELRYLREEKSRKEQDAFTSSSSSSSSSSGERDMFIPIMTAVSITGFLGAYGYETLRLASRGELYLPF